MVVMEGDDKMVQTQYGDKEVKIIREFTDTHMKTVNLELNSFLNISN